MKTVLLLFLLSALAAAISAGLQPTAHVRNGSIAGVHLSSFHQDAFLGIPYAQPPVGSLRFADPEPLTSSWTGLKHATQYSPACLNFGEGPWASSGPKAEDCLTLNVVRPSKLDHLPVAVWIHGGAYLQGGSRDPRYNLTHIVDQGVKSHAPFIGVSVNYRLGGLGFLWGSAIQAARAGNLGLKDQRLALRWVRDNIAAFGGDPSKVAVWGESAGASSIGHLLVAKGGLGDALFRAVILQSGSASNAPWLNEYATAKSWDEVYSSLVTAVHCNLAINSLECLRQVPIEMLADALNRSVATGRRDFRPVIDGDLVPLNPVTMLQSGRFVHVPVLQGQNREEGWTFAPKGIRSDKQFMQYLAGLGFTKEQAVKVADAYPSTNGSDTRRGAMFERAATVLGDVAFDAMRRFMAQVWAKNAVPSFSYQFAVPVEPAKRAGHFQEVAFVFHNLGGEGYPSSENPFAKTPESHRRTATLMARTWASFIANLTVSSPASSVDWPVYSTDKPQMLVLDADATALAHVEPDTYRGKGIALLQDIFQSR